MRAIKLMATIDERGHLCIDEPLKLKRNCQVEVIVLIAEVTEINEDEQSNQAILADFRQAWHEAMTGKTIPVSQIWEGIEDGRSTREALPADFI
ncbi:MULTISPECIES: hypothetical protein [unclassified Microcoleus]|uniref:type II toxin-antitoxin system RelN family antitoxin n=1 Tax=unclassified Microcoleus TaxID=2642155 RepID=UPI002FCF01DB